MAEDAKYDAERLKAAAKREAERVSEAAARESERFERHLREDPELQQEWIRQDNLIYGGLMGIGIVMVQPFLVATSMSTPATICVVAFSVAIPLLAALILVNRQETFRNQRTKSRLVEAARALAQFAAFVGLVAGFWHIHWLAGVVLLVTAVVAMGVHSAGFTRLETGVATPQETDGGGDAEKPGGTQR